MNTSKDKTIESTTPSTQPGYQSPIILVKKIPAGISENELARFFDQFGEIRQINIMKAKLYAYIEFSTLADATRCVEYHSKYPLSFGNQTAEVFMTCGGKNDQKPLDLNPPSSIILLTFFKIRVKVTVSLVLELLRDFEPVKKIVIYEKQNLHALVEMDTSPCARKVKDLLDGKTWKNCFLVRVQYTSKKSISVNPSSPFEYEANSEAQADLQEEESETHESYYMSGGYMDYHPPHIGLRPAHPPSPVRNSVPVNHYPAPHYQPYHPYHVSPGPPAPPKYLPHPAQMPPGSRSPLQPQKPAQPPQQQQQQQRYMQPPPQPSAQSQPPQPARTPEVNPKELYYYNGSHQYAPPTYPQMFNSPQIVQGFSQPTFKYTHDRADERYLLQYCSPFVRPRPLNPQAQPKIDMYKIVKVAGLRDHERSESLLNLCLQFGVVVALKVVKREKKSECFVLFSHHAEATAAVEALDGVPLNGAHMAITLTKYLNMQEIDIFEKGKTTLFMDFSSEIENQSGLDSPVVSRKKTRPTRFLFFNDLTPKHKNELEALLSVDRPVVINARQGGIQVEFRDVPSAVDVLARVHHQQLSDGSIISVEFELQSSAKPDSFDHNGPSLALPRHQEARKSSEVSSNEVAVEEEDEGQCGSEEKQD